jgi:predicted TIM-barrel fold metal-dependent hydrolase
MRADCHIHIDRIGPPHRTGPPSVAEVVDYARREGIGLFGAIYEQEETLTHFRDAGLNLFPFFWVRSPLAPTVPASARGIKLHPFIERYQFTVEAVLPTLLIAQSRGLPILVHMDDREPSLSRGELAADIASRFPDITFILAHSGAYAPGIIELPGESTVPDGIVRELVAEAIEAAVNNPNILLETSVLASNVKADLLVRSAPRARLLIGTDFPICKESYGSVVYQERQLSRSGMTHQDIQAIHENAYRVLGNLS